MEEIWMPKAEVNAGRKPHIVRYLLNKLLKPYTENRISLLEKCHTIDFRLSRQMIETGYKQSSRFGWWCPVKVSINSIELTIIDTVMIRVNFNRIFGYYFLHLHFSYMTRKLYSHYMDQVF